MNVDSIGSFAMKKRNQWIISFSVIAILFLLLNIIFFFIKLNSTMSDSSWGDIGSFHQLWYNFVNGRPFQASIATAPGHGELYNPYAYITVMAWAVVITPMLFTAIYFFNQNVNTLYLIVILFNYLGMSIVIWKIMQYKCKYEYRDRLMLALSFLFITGGLFQIISYKCHPILFLGPFLLALYYFFIRQKYVPYLITTVLICLITQDAAAFLVGWAIYLALFEERKIDSKYKYSLLTFIIASVYLFLVVFIISPAATYHLVPTSDYAYTSHLLEGVHRMLSGESISRFSNVTNNLLLGALLPLREFMPAIGIMMALPISYLIFDRRLNVEWKKICGLIFIAPITHIVISYVIAGGHHLQPFLLCILLALVLLLCSDTIEKNDKGEDRKESLKVRGKKYYYLIFVFVLLVYTAVCLFNFIVGYGGSTLVSSTLYKLIYAFYMIILFVCILLPLVLLLSGDLRVRKLSILQEKRHYLTIFLILFLVVMSNGYFVGATVYTGMLTFDDANKELIESNRATIRCINELPANGSVVYWTNRNVMAFISGRSDLWRFPRYFDKADYLVIQKNVNASFFEIPHQKDISVLEAIDKGVCGSTGDIRSITDEDIEKMTHYLVFENKSHRISRDDENNIVLEKIHKETFEMPYFTVGFGWVWDVPKVVERYTR